MKILPRANQWSAPAPARFADSYMPDPNSGCWLWAGAGRPPMGYGRISVDGQSVSAHRYSWELHKGPIPAGLMVLHKCDVPCCVNPEHLFLGTQKDNAMDMTRKGRHTTKGYNNQPKGEAHNKAKLTEELVRKIRLDTRSRALVAKDYGVTATLIGYIINRKIWRHVS